MELTSHNQYLYQWLLAGRSITNREAILHHGIGRLNARISELILDYGVPIQKISEPNTNNSGYHTRYFMDNKDIQLLKHTPLQLVHKTINNKTTQTT